MQTALAPAGARRPRVRWASRCAIVAGVAFAVCTPASAQPGGDGIVLRYHRGGTTLRGRWGVVGEVQRALDDALTECGQPTIKADGIFGKGSQDGLRRLDSCPGFGAFEIGQGEANDGVVGLPLWNALRPNAALPSVRERALVLWLSHEATDYDRVEFNFGSGGQPQSNDPKSYLTWGPYGATVGHGREVQGILASPEVADDVEACLGAEVVSVRALLTASDEEAKETVRAAFVDPARREAWQAGFACLGGRDDVRAAYDAYAFETDKWFRPAVRRLYGLIPDAETTATDTDFAFFVDLAMHMGISAARMDAARHAIEEAKSRVARPLSSAERRRAVGQALVATLSNQVEDRRGRNVVYYVDGIGEDGLTVAERTAWRARSGLRASDVGLIDVVFEGVGPTQ